MKIGEIEICYIPYKKTAYQIAKEEMARLTVKEINSIVIGATLIAVANFNTLMAKPDVKGFTSKIDAKGLEILLMIQAVGYWAAIIFAGIDIVKQFKKQDVAGIIAVATKYAVSVGILYGLPQIFDVIKDLFN